ncbi:MAG: RNA polymerase sigma factor [Caulobacteraceae bacterium]
MASSQTPRARTHWPSALSDLELARLSGRGDREASAELVRRAAGVVGDLLRRMGAADALADDITQDAMVTALGAITGYRGEAAFATWAMRIAGRLYLKRRRKEARYELMEEPVDPQAAGASGEAASVARLDLDRALALLSAPERICVSLCHGAGLTHEEIAQTLTLPLGTVKSHVTRGLKKLRTLMIGSDADE